MTLYQSRDSVSLSNNTTKSLILTVPKGKIWRVYAIYMHNGDDVSRNLSVFILNGNNNIVHKLAYASGVGAGVTREMLGYIPSSVSEYGCVPPVIIKGGNKLKLNWAAGGTSSGGTAYYCVTYEEIPE